MASIEHFEMVKRDFLQLAERAGLPEPDEVRYDEGAEEIEAIWHEQKLAVIVALDPCSERAVEAGSNDDLPF